MNRRTASLRLCAALVGELAAGLLLARTGAADLPSNLSARSPMSALDPIDIASGVARWVAIALLSYLVIVTALQLLAVALGCIAPTRDAGVRLAGLASRLGPRTVAGLAAAAVIVSTASACVPAAGAGPGPAGPARATVVMVLESSPDTPRPTPAITMHLESDPTTTAPSSPAAPADPVAEPEPVAAPEPVAVPEPTTPGELGTVVVVRGDSFWSIAEDVLSTRLGRAPTGQETATYWHQLVEANRPRLVDSADPDLIYAGQRFVLP